MKRLYHWPLDPASRTVRLVLGEKSLQFEERISPPWAQDPEVGAIAPGAIAPALIDRAAGGPVGLVGTHAICEHLEEVHPSPRLLPSARSERAEARRMWRWSEDAFDEVNRTLLSERISQWVKRNHRPDSGALRTGAHALRGRVTFLNALLETRDNMAGRQVTIADLSIAANLSAYDYFGDVQWEKMPELRLWYGRMKSRPAFRPLLMDRMDGVKPVPHYADLDF